MPHASDDHHQAACLKQAIEMMNNSQRGLEAMEGRYYTEMFGWLFGKLRDGVIPSGIPVKLLEEWQKIGSYRKRK